MEMIFAELEKIRYRMILNSQMTKNEVNHFLKDKLTTLVLVNF